MKHYENVDQQYIFFKSLKLKSVVSYNITDLVIVIKNMWKVSIFLLLSFIIYLVHPISDNRYMSRRNEFVPKFFANDSYFNHF
jgi:hypothetical protein